VKLNMIHYNNYNKLLVNYSCYVIECRNIDPTPFCDEDDYMSGKLSCTDDHKVIARCNMRNFTYLPKEYQVSMVICVL